ncbi:hypothetical protein J2S40_001284 [Nocardioides luteus]|nr:hypothetical protein [Nocardioides luteus]MDR7310226.1 hypothetical protein [Nocardioides luteus]
MLEKAETIKAARVAMARVAQRYDEAQKSYDLHELKLPMSHGPAPSASDPKYTTEGYSGDEKTKREKAFDDAKAEHAKEAKAIADAERDAAFHCQQIDDGNHQAEPKVRAITELPSTSSGGGGGAGGGAGAGAASGGYASLGSRSAVRAAQAKYDSVNPGTLYADGYGHEIRAEQMEIIKQAHAENIPEWDDAAGEWVNADGSPAPATSYASIETAEGLAPLAGGTGGGAALGIGLGGAGLAAGAVAALKAKFGAGAATAASRAGAASSARAATARTAAGASRAGAPAQGARTGARGMGGAGGRVAGGRGAAGAGSRGQMRGAGAGNRGRGKDQKNGDPEVDLMADYSSDYSDEEYERLLAQKRFDEEQKRALRSSPEE